MLTAAALTLVGRTPAWVAMAAISFALFGGLKWWSLWRARRNGRSGGMLAAGYLFGWPGMDAGAFLTARDVPRPAAGEWFAAAVKTAIGAAVTWGLARQVVYEQPLAAAWIGWIGLGLMLHCGLFHLLSILWRTAGIDAPPIMDRPLASASVSDFWSRRWNRAFRDLVHAIVFRPVARKLGAAGGTWGVFVVSGLVHELAISVPAQGGYGLPTLYFVIQGAAMLGERRWKPSGPIGRLWAAAVILGPAWLLFHPPFMREVVLPLLDVLRATS